MAKNYTSYWILGLIGMLIVGGFVGYFLNNNTNIIPQQTLFSVVDASSLEREIIFTGFSVTQKTEDDYVNKWTIQKDSQSYIVSFMDLKTLPTSIIQQAPQFGTCGSFTGYLDNIKPTSGEFRDYKPNFQLYHHTVYFNDDGYYLLCKNNFIIESNSPEIFKYIQ